MLGRDGIKRGRGKQAQVDESGRAVYEGSWKRDGQRKWADAQLVEWDAVPSAEC